MHRGASLSRPCDPAHYSSVGEGEIRPVMPELHPASFRDPKSGVVVEGADVYRFFAGDAVADFEQLRDSGLLDELVRRGALLPVSDVSTTSSLRLTTSLPPGAVLVRQPALPFVSYPYEW